MGLIRAINRGVESRYLSDEVFASLRIIAASNKLHSLTFHLSSVRCHLGKGGEHTAIEAHYSTPGFSSKAAFHLCRMKGYGRATEMSSWDYLDWFFMAPSAETMAARIFEFSTQLEALAEATHIAFQTQDETPEADLSDNDDPFYSDLVEVLQGTKLGAFEPYVTVGLGGSVPSEAICFQSLHEPKDYLIVAKKNQVSSLTGRWSAWFLAGDAPDIQSVEELTWSLTIFKSLTLEEQVGKYYAAIGELIANSFGIAPTDVLGENYKDATDYPLAIIYSDVIHEMERRDFCGRGLSRTQQLEGITDMPSITFALPGEPIRIVAITRINADRWIGHLLILSETEEVEYEPIPWNFAHSEDSVELADEFVWLAYRLAYGDLRGMARQ